MSDEKRLISNLCFFMTILPSERNNYLAIHLPRYHKRDPYVADVPEETSGKERIRIDERESISSDAVGSVGAVSYNGQRYKQVCLVSAFRGLGLEIPYTRDGPFWVMQDGNELLAACGFVVMEVDREALYGDGLYVLHRNYHFFGCTVREGVTYMHDRVNGDPVTEMIQLELIPLHRDLRVFQLFMSATGLPADPCINERSPKVTMDLLGHGRRSMPPASENELARRRCHRQASVIGEKICPI